MKDLRILPLVLVAGVAAVLGAVAGAESEQRLLWAAGSMVVAGTIFFLLSRVTPGRLIGGVAGTVSGLLMAALLAWLVALTPGRELLAQWTPMAIGLILVMILATLGVSVGARVGQWRPLAVQSIPTDRSREGDDESIFPKVVDTSVIIDGRAADVIATGFVDGPLIVPHFVLRELHSVADSSDTLKRNRGRKGLDVLEGLQESPLVNIEISDRDFPEIPDVDGKLIALAEELGASVLTTDYNLNKVAQLRGVQVLNVNDLANALKPVVLPGETLQVQVIKEGKERNQGVGYLDDGTMVVIDDGRPHLGEQVDVVVTSVIQTNAGKMIFGAVDVDDAKIVRRMPPGSQRAAN
ncbi:MAG: PIN domain-containing protein [Acidobacteriota bacterium]